MRVRVVLATGELVEVDNMDWHATEPAEDNPLERVTFKPERELLVDLNREFPTGEFPPDQPLESARFAIENPTYGGTITGTIEEPLNLPEGAIA